MKHLTAIDGLRAVAVLSVVAYHAGLPVPAGYVGVDIFFVISGYLITRLLSEELQAGRIDFMAFYARRARRILPALAVVILVTLGLSVVLLPDASSVARSAAAAGVFVANLFFQAQASDYWAASSETTPLLHLWSLSVEEQFYLVWPVVLLLSRRKPVAALATLALCSLALAEWWLWRTPSTAFYEMPARAWELAAGGLVALVPARMPRGVAWAGLALTLAACFVPIAHFPGVGALPAVAGAALLIAGIQNGQRVPALEARPVVYVGLLSYSLYLWHWPLLALWRATHAESPLAVRLGLCALAFGLAALSYRYVETPLRKARTSNRRAVLAGGAVVALLASTAWAVPSKPGDWSPLRESCYQALDASTGFAPACKPGAEVAFFGDSMALAWQPLIPNAALYSRGACPPQVGYRHYSGERGDKCTRFIADGLAQAQRAKVVILAEAWADHWGQERRAQSARELDATLAALAGRRVYLIGPSPTLPPGGALPRARFDAQAAPIRAELARLAAKHGATVIDPTDWLCTATECPPERDGVRVYWDTRHIAASLVRRVKLPQLQADQHAHDPAQ